MHSEGYCSQSECQSVGRSVGRYICPHFFSQNVAVVDTKCGYVGMCNRRLAQQESGATLSKDSVFDFS